MVQIKPMGGRHKGTCPPITRLQGFVQLVVLPASKTYQSQSSHHGAHLPIKKRSRLDGKKNFFATVKHFKKIYRLDRGACLTSSRAKRGKVVRANKKPGQHHAWQQHSKGGDSAIPVPWSLWGQPACLKCDKNNTAGWQKSAR